MLMNPNMSRTHHRVGSGTITVYRVKPGAGPLLSAIQDFSAQGDCLMSALDQGVYNLIARLVEQNLEIEAVPFGALVGRVCQWVGLPFVKVAPIGLAESAIAHACRTRSSLFTGQRQGSRYASYGLTVAVANTLSELRYLGCDADSLAEHALHLPPLQANRINELAQIMRASNDTLRQLGREHLSAQLERIVAHDPHDSSNFEIPERLFLAGLQDMSYLQADFVHWVARSGSEIAVCVECQALGDCSKLFSRPVTVLGFGQPEHPGGESSVSGHFAELLFSDSVTQTTTQDPAPDPAPEPAPSPDVEIFAAGERLSECEWTLRACAEAMADGVAAKQMAIVARDEAYFLLLEGASQRLGVPLRISVRLPLVANRLVGFVLRLCRALAAEDVRELWPCLSSAYAELEPADWQAARLSLREIQRGQKPWERLEQVLPELAWAPDWLEPVLDWRREALGLPGSFASPTPVQEEFDLAGLQEEDLDFLDQLVDRAGPDAVPALEWLKRVESLLEMLPILDAPEHSDSEYDRRAQKRMCSVLYDEASVDKVRLADALTFDQAIHWFEEVWARSDCSVPSRPEGIWVASSAKALPPVSHLWVLGMTDLRFPRRAVGDPILPDMERKQLFELGVPIQTSEEKLVGQDREEFVRICSTPSVRLTLSYPQIVEGRGVEPSSYLTELERVAGPIERRVRSDILPELSDCILEADLRLRRALSGPTRLPAEVEVSPETQERLRVGSDRPLTLNSARDAIECPFRFQARRLRLVDDGVRRFDTLLSDLPRQVGLPSIADREEAKTKLVEGLDKLLERLQGVAEVWELKLNRLRGLRYIEELVEREFAARHELPREILQEVPTSFAWTVTLDGVPLTLRDRVAAVTIIEGRKSLLLYRFSKLRNLNDKFAERFYEFCARSLGDTTLVEVDSPGGREIFGNPSLTKRGRVAAYRFTPTDNAVADAQLMLAAAVAHSGSMRPTPDPRGCLQCDFGELCRRSYEFSEKTASEPEEVIDATD